MLTVPPSWLQRYFADVDNMRLQPLLDRHTPDVTVQVANMPPVTGLEQVGVAMQGFWQLFGGIRHQFRNVWDTGDGTTVCEFVTTYTRHDGHVVSLPAASLLHRTDPDVDGRVDSLRIFADMSPVFAPGGSSPS